TERIEAQGNRRHVLCAASEARQWLCPERTPACQARLLLFRKARVRAKLCREAIPEPWYLLYQSCEVVTPGRPGKSTVLQREGLADTESAGVPATTTVK